MAQTEGLLQEKIDRATTGPEKIGLKATGPAKVDPIEWIEIVVPRITVPQIMNSGVPHSTDIAAPVALHRAATVAGLKSDVAMTALRIVDQAALRSMDIVAPVALHRAATVAGLKTDVAMTALRIVDRADVHSMGIVVPADHRHMAIIVDLDDRREWITVVVLRLTSLLAFHSRIVLVSTSNTAAPR